MLGGGWVSPPAPPELPASLPAAPAHAVPQWQGGGRAAGARSFPAFLCVLRVFGLTS